MVNWDPKALTALSDEEVIFKEQQSKLYYLRYKVVGEDTYAIVATTRPETIMGDTAMCINPKQIAGGQQDGGTDDVEDSVADSNAEMGGAFSQNRGIE